jgi:hypothetical protein
MSHSHKSSARPNYLFLGAAAVGVAGAVALAYRFFFARRKVIDVKALVKILTDIARAWQEVADGTEAQRSELLQLAQGKPASEVSRLQEQYALALKETIDAREAQIIADAGITRAELETACLAHADDPAVAFILRALSRVYANDDDAAGGADDDGTPLEPLSLEVTVSVMSTVLELTVTEMEAAFRAVAARLDPSAATEGRAPRMTEAFRAQLNDEYGSRFLPAREKVFRERGVGERQLSASCIAHQHEPAFLEVTSAHQKRKAQVFRALGLSGSAPAPAAGAHA